MEVVEVKGKGVLVLAHGISYLTVAASLGVLAPLAGADPAPHTSPYVATVRGTEVNLRTGGSKNFRAFAAVRMGQKLLVQSEQNGWCKVHIPTSIPVYAHKGYVEIKGSRGIVRATELNLRVSPQRKSADEVVGSVPRGSEIEILETDGDWLKIVPPPSAFAYVSRDYLNREGDAVPADVARQIALLDDPSRNDGAPPTARKKQGKTAEKVVTAPASLAVPSSGLSKGDALFRDVQRKEIGERDYRPARAIYEEIREESEDRAEVAAAEKALKLIADQETREATIREAQASIAEVKRKNLEIEDHARQARRSDRSVASDIYVARGWVSGAGRAGDQEATHRLMKGSQVLYYLKSEEGNPISLDSYLSKRVGVKGSIRELDPKFGANLIIVKEIEVLSDR